MTKEQIIDESVDILKKLPREKAEEILHFLVKYYEKKDEELFEKGFEKLIYDSGSFDFLKDEPDLYSDKDLIKRYK
jgi:hypothetical protein